MAYDRLRDALTRGNLWLYILAALEEGPATPVELKSFVGSRHGFEPATITFYSVLYKLRREGLVRKSSSAYRSTYEITHRGTQEMARGRELLRSTEQGLTRRGPGTP